MVETKDSFQNYYYSRQQVHAEFQIALHRNTNSLHIEANNEQSRDKTAIMENCRDYSRFNDIAGDTPPATLSSNDQFRLADTYMGKSLKSDMTFVLAADGTRIPGHTLIVSAASQVMDNIISDPDWCGGKEIVINIDCPEKSFMQLLRSIYTPGIYLWIFLKCI